MSQLMAQSRLCCHSLCHGLCCRLCRSLAVVIVQFTLLYCMITSGYCRYLTSTYSYLPLLTFAYVYVVRFESDRPVSLHAPLVFEDSLGNSYSLMVTATADNCILTCYPFLAQHRLDHQIVCEEVGYITQSFHMSMKTDDLDHDNMSRC